jgi:hypothetical protein
MGEQLCTYGSGTGALLKGMFAGAHNEGGTGSGLFFASFLGAARNKTSDG